MNQIKLFFATALTGPKRVASVGEPQDEQSHSEILEHFETFNFLIFLIALLSPALHSFVARLNRDHSNF